MYKKFSALILCLILTSSTAFANGSSVDIGARTENVSSSSFANGSSRDSGARMENVSSSSFANVSSVDISARAENVSSSSFANVSSRDISARAENVSSSSFANVSSRDISARMENLSSTSFANVSSVDISARMENLSSTSFANVSSVDSGARTKNVSSSFANVSSVDSGARTENVSSSSLANVSSVNIGARTENVSSSSFANGSSVDMSAREENVSSSSFANGSSGDISSRAENVSSTSFANVSSVNISARAGNVSSAEYSHDIIIAGGGMSGVSAAIQATRLGATVLIIEPTSMLGGQATAAGVSTMDDMTRLKESGIYREFMDRVRKHYAAMGKSIATSYWKTDGKAFEPKVGSDILKVMAGSADILYHSEIVSVKPSANGKIITAKTPNGTKIFTCKILIDATEYGDVIPLAGLKYRSGNSVSPDMNPDSMIQDITWTMIIRKYPKGVPEHLRPKKPLPEYERARKNYTAYVSRNAFGAGNRSPFKLPAEFSAHNGYRAIPDSYMPGSYTGMRRDWKRITKTGVNWGNDYPGQYGWDEKFGIPIAYLEDKSFREHINREALIKTLHFIWYIQNDLGESWSVDENEYNDLPKEAEGLPEEWKNIARHLPPIPYVRESRRIVGDYTYNSHAIYTNSESYRNGKKNQEIPDSIAIGGYILDLHTGDDDDDFEHELGERQAAMRTHEPAGAFQVPMRIFIPASDDNFLAAEKNLSMSRLATSALRLQPVCMMTGQAVGTLAALAVSRDVKPREIHAVKVQKVLADSGVMMSLSEYIDVPERSEYYGAVQIATLYRLIEPEKYPVYPKQRISTPSKTRRVPGRFGVNKAVTRKEFSGMISRAESAMNITGLRVPEYHEGLTRGEAVSIIVEAMSSK